MEEEDRKLIESLLTKPCNGTSALLLTISDYSVLSVGGMKLWDETVAPRLEQARAGAQLRKIGPLISF